MTADVGGPSTGDSRDGSGPSVPSAADPLTPSAAPVVGGGAGGERGDLGAWRAAVGACVPGSVDGVVGPASERPLLAGDRCGPAPMCPEDGQLRLEEPSARLGTAGPDDLVGSTRDPPDPEPAGHLTQPALTERPPDENEDTVRAGDSLDVSDPQCPTRGEQSVPQDPDARPPARGRPPRARTRPERTLPPRSRKPPDRLCLYIFSDAY